MIDLEAQHIIRLLLYYVHHNCTYHETDSPRDDVCRCNVGHIRQRAEAYLNKKE